MNIKIIGNENCFDSLKDQWNDLACRAESHIHQTFEWNRTWWKYFGTEGNLYLILFYCDGRLVGIAPLFRDTVSIFGRRIYQCIRFLGSNVSQPEGEALIGLVAYSDYLNLIIEPGYEDQVARNLADHLTTANLPCDEILFEEVPENSTILTYLVPILQARGDSVVIENSSSCIHIQLSKSWDEYLTRLSKNSRKKARRYLKKVEDEDQKIFKIDEPSNIFQLTEAYETLVRVHQKQWNDQGFPGMFYEKRMSEFTKEICLEFFKNGWLQIKKLTPLNDKTSVAIDLFFTYKKRVYSIIGGMDYQNSLLTNEGAGNIIFTSVLKEAIENDYEMFDYIRGAQNYKLRKADHVMTNRNVLVQHSDERGQHRIQFVKKAIHIQRRLRVEVIQFKLFFREKNLADGLRAYLSFISQRINTKRTSANLKN